MLNILVCLYFDEILHKAHEENLAKIKQLQDERKDNMHFTSSLQCKTINLQNQFHYAYSSYQEYLREVIEKYEREICGMKEEKKALEQKIESKDLELERLSKEFFQLQESSKVMDDAEAQPNDVGNDFIIGSELCTWHQ